MLNNFNQQYQPSIHNTIATEELINAYREKVPAQLIHCWKTTGLGKYNNGLIEIINPADYEPVLWTWLGKVVPNYTPFAITGFGELFYYRKLTEVDEDVCMIDIQYRKIETLVWSLEAFFDGVLTNEEDKKTWLREELFIKAIAEQGELAIGEVFTFVPILAAGGTTDVSGLKKGNARVYQDLVFQMTS